MIRKPLLIAALAIAGATGAATVPIRVDVTVR